MARKLRLEFAGACYHVINRGNYRRDLFREEGARQSFEATLFEAAERFGWWLHAFVIMRNHFHLAVETPEPNLGDGMRWLQATWAMRFNRYRKTGGHPFQGRYRAQHVEPGHTLAQVAHYIHLNPVRAKVVPLDGLAGFRWSSLHHYQQRSRPPRLEPRVLLAESGRLADTPKGWRNYLEYLALLAEENPTQREARFRQLARGWYVGSNEFRRDLLQALKDRGAELETERFAGVEREAWDATRQEAWRERLRRAAQVAGIEPSHLPPKRSAPQKVMLAALMKLTTSATNAWLAAELNMGKPATVSQYVRRFRLKGGEDEPAFRRVLSKVKP